MNTLACVSRQQAGPPPRPCRYRPVRGPSESDVGEGGRVAPLTTRPTLRPLELLGGFREVSLWDAAPCLRMS